MESLANCLLTAAEQDKAVNGAKRLQKLMSGMTKSNVIKSRMYLGHSVSRAMQ